MNTTTASDGQVALLVENHTREKLHYLGRYIYEFATATKEKWPTRNFIDLFAGPGINVIEGVGQEVDGSSLLAVKAKYPFETYHACDIEKGFLDTLSARREQAIQVGAVMDRPFFPYVGDSNQQVDRILRSINPRYSINLVIIDPPGANCHWETIRKLSGLKYVDLVINFPLGMAIKRNIHQSYEVEGGSALDRFFGTDEWRRIYEQAGGQPHVATRPLIDLYKRRLADELGHLGDSQVNEKTNSSPVGIRREEGQKLYLLIFASRSPLAHHLWSQAIQINDEGQRRLPGF